MIDGSQGTPESVIIEKILGDARSEARRIIEKAQRALDSQRKNAEMEASRLRHEIIRRKMEQIDKLRKREISIARIEAKRILLNTREKLISIVLDGVKQRLSVLRREPGYREVLLNLASEAVRSIGGAHVILRLSKLDEKIVDADFITELVARLGERPKIEIRTDLDENQAGCIAVSSDYRMIFDNTFDARIRRFERVLRARIAEEIQREDE